MLIALEAGLAKLREYYARTDHPKAGDVYAHSIILAPKQKMQYFKGKEWTGPRDETISKQTWGEYYHETLQDRIKIYQYEEDIPLTTSQALAQDSEIDRMWEDGEEEVEQDELKRYLEAGKPLPLSLYLFLYFNL